MDLEPTRELYNPQMGPNNPLKSNKWIPEVLPSGHYQRTINPGSSTLKEAADAYDWPHFMEVKIEFRDGDSTIMQCKNAIRITTSTRR